MAKKQKQQRAGAPDWMVTYGDAMTLLLCFFVIIVSMSEVKQNQRFQDVLESLRVAFGGYEGAVGAVPVENEPNNVLIQKLLQLEVPIHTKHEGDTDEEGLEGKEFRVTNVRDGLEVVIGGRITFERFSATLKPEAQDLIRKSAERLRGYNTRLLIRGHATREPLPEHSLYSNARDLSYARATAVAQELERSGIRPIRMVLIACGDNEPVVRQAYTEDRRALNRRVEIIVTEELIVDFEGAPVPGVDQEFPDGGKTTD